MKIQDRKAEMNVPVEFKEFARLFLQGSDRWVSDENAWIDQAVQLLDRNKRPIVGQFISNLIASEMTEQELRVLWNTYSPWYGLSQDGDVRAFLSKVCERLLQGQD